MSWLFASRQPKCWSFSFSISPCNEYSGSISFRIDWFDLHCVSYPVDSCRINIIYECVYLLTNIFLFLCHCSRCVSYKSLMFGCNVGSLLLFVIVFVMKMDIVGLISFILVYAIHLAFLGLLAFFLPVCMHAKSLQSCWTLCNPMDCGLPGSSIHRDSPGKNTGSSRPRDQTHISQVSYIGKPFCSSNLWPNVLCICSFYPSDLKSGEFCVYWVNGYRYISKSDRSCVLTSVSRTLPALVTLSRESDRPIPLPILPTHVHLPIPKIFFDTTLAFKSKLMILFNYQSFSFYNYFHI